MPKVFYTTDGGKNWTPAPEGLRVSVESTGILLDGDDPVDIAINFTDEGIITDIVATSDSEILGTESQTYTELCERLTVLGVDTPPLAE